MGLRFRQSFQLFPGVRLNFSGSGISASFGMPGATVNVGSGGVRTTVGLPSTGLSYTHRSSKAGEGTPQPPSSPSVNPQPAGPSFTPSYAYQQMHAMREINSASVEDLTSHTLVELRDLIAQARKQKHEVEADLKEARKLHDTDVADLARRQRSLFRYFYKRRIAELEEGIPLTQAEIERLEEWNANTHIDMSFATTETAKRAYGSLIRAFETLRGSTKIWDITSDRHTHRVIERSAASRTLERKPVSIDFASSELLRFEGRAMRFGNVNGEDILVYPGIILMPRADGAFALIDLREVDLEFRLVSFVEEEAVPTDSEVIGETWAKVNKNGTPDLRFKNNYRIPIAQYGRMLFTSPGGVQEEYQFSNAAAATEFAKSFSAYQAALASGA
jgi:hypothetical protein